MLYGSVHLKSIKNDCTVTLHFVYRIPIISYTSNNKYT